MSNELLGDNFKLFHDTADNFTTPTWVEQTSIGDLSFNTNSEQVEIPLRETSKFYKKGRDDWELSFSMNYDPDNAFHTVIRNAIRLGTKVHLAFSDDVIAGGFGNYFHAWFLLSGPVDAALDSGASIDVTAKPHIDRGAASDELPAYVAATS